MEGLMQDWPLRVTTIIDHAVRAHPEQEIVTRTVEGPIHRYTYKDLHSRSKKAAKALLALGVKKATELLPSLGIPIGTWKPGTALWVLGRFAIR